jgi:hypothetical protein
MELIMNLTNLQDLVLIKKNNFWKNDGNFGLWWHQLYLKWVYRTKQMFDSWSNTGDKAWLYGAWLGSEKNIHGPLQNKVSAEYEKVTFLLTL